MASDSLLPSPQNTEARKLLKTILLVEDEAELLDLLQTSLSAQYNVLTAQNGEEALAVLKKQTPDLIITDVLMPRMTGYQFHQALRQIKNELREIPVIVMSGRGSMKDLFDSSSIAYFLPKPFTDDELMGIIANILGGSPAPSNIKTQTSIPVSNPARSAVVTGVDEYTVKAITAFLKSQNFTVEIGLDEEDTCKIVSKTRPHLVLCQYWEDPGVFNALAVHKTLKASAETNQIPFAVFCLSALGIEAAKTLTRGQVITFQESKELIEKLSVFLGTLASAKSY